jgi:hypothetical protein
MCYHVNIYNYHYLYTHHKWHRPLYWYIISKSKYDSPTNKLVRIQAQNKKWKITTQNHVQKHLYEIHLCIHMFEKKMHNFSL